MIVNFKFKLPEETEEYERAANGYKAFAALHDVRQEIFRGARKHGYNDRKLQALLERLDALDVQQPGHEEEGGGTELIGLLEAKFSEILAEYGITEI